MSNLKQYSIALLGCGRISEKHLESITTLSDNFKLTGVCDIVTDLASSAGEKYGANWYTDFEEMLTVEKPEIVSICTPSGLHPDHGILAAEHKCHVITEKPIGTSIAKVDELINSCDQNRVRLFVVKQNRLNATMLLLKKAVEKKRFGKIYFIHSNVFWTRPQKYYDVAKWRGTWEFDGGAFMNQASHYVDALQWLIGPVDSVMAQTATMARTIETEDTGAAILKFRNGTIGSLNVTMLTYPKNLEGSITILGEKGTVKIGGTAINKIEKWEFEEYDDDDSFLKDADYNPPDIYGFGHLPYYRNIFDSLEGNSEANTDGRSGRKSLELVLAIYQSAQTGMRVPLPLKI
jgi:UDP-N-acetyl-2-amino-2-deoxyglucuronate dehydrogenase